MKNLYTLLAVTFTVLVSHAQIITIPDANFKAKLLAANTSNYIAQNSAGYSIKIDANDDGEIQVSEALLVYKLYIQGPSITNPYPINDLTGIEYFTNLRLLDCKNQALTSLPINNLIHLTSLDCSNNHITSLTVANLSNLESLIVKKNDLTTLDVSALTNLNTLDCDENDISNLNVNSATSLMLLRCSSNNLSTLTISNLINLKYLECLSNGLNGLDVTNLVSLLSLQCNNNNISSLNLANLTNLRTLSCGNNNLSALDVSNLTQLQYLSCNNNEISTLDLTNLTLLYNLNCSDNNISYLNFSNVGNLTTLSVQKNNFTSIDFSPLTQLTYLNFGNQQLQPIDFNAIPNKENITYLGFYGGDQTSIDISNFSALQNLRIEHTNLTEVDGSHCPVLRQVTFQYNSQLTFVNIKTGGPTFQNAFFSNCPMLNYICCNEYDINLVDNYISNQNGSNLHINSYCSFTPGDSYNTIEGIVHYDSDFNGCSASDSTFAGVRIGINDGTSSGATFSVHNGSYSFLVQKPNITLTPSFENPSYFNVSPSSVSFNFPSNNNSIQTQDFCMERNGIHNDLEIMIIPIDQARPGFDANYKILYKNKGTEIQSGSVTLLFDDTKMDFVSSNPLISSSATNSLTWNFTNLHPFESRIASVTFNINSPTETPAVTGGDVLSFTANANGAVDETPIDNTFNLNQTVVNSFDPNDKTCLEGTTVSPSAVGEYVHYLIRFENTGTANAENIVIRDIINTAKFDLASLVPMSSSHPFTTRISNSNRVEFIFQNINLPFDYANNDGYVAFKIKTKPTLVVGDTFSNTANIYFDYNYPITTNTFTTTVQALSNPDFDFGSVFTLSPVPAQNTLTITPKENVVMSSASIYNTLGQLVQVNTNPGENIDVSGLQSGSYFIKIISDKGSATGKFIKE